jgi:SAM-dependent methyltransferase
MDTQQGGTHSRDTFDGRYGGDLQFMRGTSPEHERFRQQSTMGALSRKAYTHAFEPGCSTGELTAQLARVCDWVSATDVSQGAVARARVRCSHWRNVDIRCADVRTHLPAEPVDLIVFSEMGQYFSAPELVRVACSLAGRMVQGGEFVAVHWLNRGPDQVLHADAVHCQLLAYLPLRWLKGERYVGLRIDSWRLE